MKELSIYLNRYYTLKNGKKVFIGTFKHPFYMPKYSVWPFVTAWNLFSFAFSGIYHLHGQPYGPCISSTMFYILVYGIFCWTHELEQESYEGRNTSYVRHNLRVGWSLFILSEVMFFFALFWAFFHSSLSPAMEIGFVWPPKGIIVFRPWEIPLANTVILLSSGAFATWAHYSVSVSSAELQLGLRFAIILGALFTYFQAKEYQTAGFSITDGIYGSLFYIITGFHGLHVFIGTVFLYNCLRKSYQGFITSSSVLVDLFVWYWHFVDVVWLFVYVFIYWWGSGFD
jgi:heme/copper-type cytochrome/quinol oxidase subunit 3